MSATANHDIEAEQGLLGAILLNNEALNRVDGSVDPEDFFEPIHAKLFELMRDTVRNGQLVSPITLKPFLPADLRVGEMTLSVYIARLAAEATTVVNAPDFARTIRDYSDTRRIAEVGTMLQIGGAEPSVVASAAIDQLDAMVARRSETSTPAVEMDEASERAMDAIARAYQRDGRITGVTWGLKDLDSKTLGMQPGELIIAAGRPGMGKTALGLTVTRRAAAAGARSLFFSLEMGDVSLTQRMISDELHEMGLTISYWLMRSGRFKPVDFERIQEAAKRIALLPIKIEQRPGLTMAQIAASARQRKRKKGLDLIVVDHLHLIKASNRYAGNKVNELGEISGGLKALAKELDVPVLALCQLSRGVESREDKRPNMSDIRASGDIEQDADVVVMLYREAYYLERSRPDENDGDRFAIWLSKMEKAMNRLDAIIEKQRSGPVGTVELYCKIACNAVRDRVREETAAELHAKDQMELM